MKLKKYLPKFVAIAAIMASSVFFSCELDDTADENPNIIIMIQCAGGTGKSTTECTPAADFPKCIADAASTLGGYLLIGNIYSAAIVTDENSTPAFTWSDTFSWDFEKITSANITVTRFDSTSSISISVYKDNKLDPKGVVALAPCTTTSSLISCTNNLSLAWKLNTEDDKTKSAAGTNGTTSSSSSSSSSSTSSTSSSSSSGTP